MAFINRFSAVSRGAITFVGNTLGLSKRTNSNQPGNRNSIGAFITTDTSLTTPVSWLGIVNLANNENITFDWRENSSSSMLNIGPSDTVLYAELIWGGSYLIGNQDVSQFIDDDVIMETPNGIFDISPDSDTSQTLTNPNFYVRTQNVTDIIQNAGAGQYTVGRVPATITPNSNTDNHVGWTLAVVCGNPTLPIRTLSVFVGSSLIRTGGAPVDVTISGFTTPTTGIDEARILSSAQEGDAIFVNDQLLFGPTVGSLVNLAGPNNPSDNFFGSQINDNNGQLDTSGTFGDRNQNVINATNIIAGRQGWDITNVNGTSALQPGQTSAVVRLITQGDTYLQNAIGIEIDTEAADLVLTKSVDKEVALVGDELLYTINVENVGEIAGDEVLFTDTPPTGTTFVPNSVTVDGNTIPGISPDQGIDLDTIGAGDSKEVTFRVTVDNQAVPTLLTNFSEAVYKFPPAQGADPIESNSISNDVITTVEGLEVNLNKEVDREFAAVGDILTYRSTIQNSSTVEIGNVIFKDIIPDNTTFIANTVKVDNSNRPGENPGNGIIIGTIPASTSVIVEFQVRVQSLPDDGIVENKSNVDYKYQLGPSEPVEDGSEESDEVTTNISEIEVNLLKEADKNFAEVGDTITYTNTIKNNSTIEINNVNFIDDIPNNTIFVPNSVKVDTIPRPGENPEGGISIGTIQSGASVVVEFQVTVQSLPNDKTVINESKVNYEYRLSPNDPIEGGSEDSNQVVTNIEEIIVNLNKGADREFAAVGDIITYRSTIQNDSTIEINNVTFTDNIPDNTTFIVNTVKVDNISKPGENPESGISIGTIPARESVVVEFQVRVQSLPDDKIVENKSNVDYKYQIGPSEPVEDGSEESNEVTTNISEITVNLLKEADKEFAEVGDTITYRSAVQNNSTLEINNVNFVDDIPTDTLFVPNSVKVDTIPRPGENPEGGISIGTIQSGASVVVEFQVIVQNVPNNKQIENESQVNYKYRLSPSDPIEDGSEDSNEVITNIEEIIVDLNKGADREFAAVGDIITYKSTIENNSTVEISNVVFTDDIPDNTVFIPNIVRVDNTSRPGENPESGISIGIIPSTGSVVVEFQVRVQSLPDDGIVENKSNVDYKYQIGLSEPVEDGNEESNEVTTNISEITVNLLKERDKEFSEVGETITYSSTIENNSTLEINNVLFTDDIPNNTTFIANSVKVDNTLRLGKNPESGINIGTIPASGSVVVEFQVMVMSVPNDKTIVNESQVNYQYRIGENEPIEKGSEDSNQVITNVEEINVNLNKGADREFASVGDIITYRSTIQNNSTLEIGNVIFTDDIPDNTVFIPNTVKVDTVDRPGENPEDGISIGTIPSIGSVVVEFQVRVQSLPNDQMVENKSNVDYKYQIGSSEPIEDGNEESNEVTTNISEITVNLLKEADKEFVEVGDIITYTNTIENNSTVEISNVNFIDMMPTNTSFVSNSVKVNNISRPGQNPANGINVGIIPVSGNAVVEFRVTVQSLPNDKQILNESQVNYEYQIGQEDKNGSEDSNQVITNVEEIIVNLNKGADREFASVGDIITYTSIIQNNSTVEISDVVFADDIPDDATFIPNTVKVDTVDRPGENPEDGITIATIPSTGSVVVEFQVRVQSLPNDQIVENKSNVDYKYQIGPSEPVEDGNEESNEVITNISEITVNLLKEADKEFVEVGDIITYTNKIENNSTVEISNVNFMDTIPANTSFVLNSVKVDNVARPGENPANGINVGIIPVSGNAVVEFQVTVQSLPNDKQILNESQVNYEYQIGQEDKNGSEDSNRVTTNVEEVIVDLNKGVDRNFAAVGDILTYRSTIENNSTIEINNVMFTDDIPDNTTFIPNTVKVDNVDRPAENPENGISIGIIPSTGSVVVEFQVRVQSLPNDQIVENKSNVDYKYQIGPSEPVEDGREESNEVTTNISEITVNLLKEADKEFVEVGDIITYTNTIENNSTVEISNVNFIDTIPTNTSFVFNSVKVNNTPRPGENPANGINVGIIPVSGNAVVEFQVTVQSLPNDKQIVNESQISYEYQIGQEEKNGSEDSNEAITNVEDITVNLNKGADRNFASVGDIITYRSTIENNSTIEINNVMFTDDIPDNTTFIPNTVKVDNVSRPGENPDSGISIGIISNTESVAVEFQVTVQSLPDDGIVENKSNVDYKYQIGPSEPIEDGNEESNEVTTNISEITVNLLKEADKEFAEVGDTITYTNTIENNSTVEISNVNFIDTIPTNTSFVSNSVKVNNTPRPGENPANGINVGIIPVLGNAVVEFQVTVQSLPNDKQILNESQVNYEYQIGQEDKNGSEDSNQVITNVEEIIVDLNKGVDRGSAAVGDILTYRSTIENNSTVEISNVMFTDDIPDDTTFIPNTVKVDNVSRPGENPASGISIGIIPNTGSVVVEFQVRVQSLPNDQIVENKSNVDYKYQIGPNEPVEDGSEESNQVTTDISEITVNLLKEADKEFVEVGDIITYTNTIENNSTLEINNVNFVDRVPTNTSFVLNSVKVDNIVRPGENPSNGISIGDIPVSESIVVEFRVIVQSLPNDKQILNESQVNYEYQVSPNDPVENGSEDSNQVITNVEEIDIAINKVADRNFASVGDIITYTSIVQNNSTIGIDNVIFIDSVPANTIFIPNSVKIDDVDRPGENPSNGINLGDINSLGSIVVEFQVQVESLPQSEVIINQSDITYEYQVGPNEPVENGSEQSNETTTNISIIRTNLQKEADKDFVEIGEVITYTNRIENNSTLEINNVNFIDRVPTNTSFVPNSVKVDGTDRPGENPESGISIGTIAVSESVVVEFKVTVQSLPDNNKIMNESQVNYEYQIGPDEPIQNGTEDSNEVITNVEEINVAVNKMSDRNFAAVGDIITYTSIIQNNSTVDLQNVNFLDRVPVNTSFVTDSVKVDGTDRPGENPATGISIGTIPSLGRIEVKFQVTVESLPQDRIVRNMSKVDYQYEINPKEPLRDGSEDSNETETNISEITVNLIKQSDKDFTEIGDIITYTNRIENNSTLEINNVNFIDVIPANTSFIIDSVKVNNIGRPGEKPENGISIGVIPASGNAVVEFQVMVMSLPDDKQILNESQVNYKYQISPNDPIENGSEDSNEVITNVEEISVAVNKQSDRNFAAVGDIITYTNTIQNNSTIDIENVAFIDRIPANTSFVVDSVKVDGTDKPGENPASGISIGIIPLFGAVEVKFEVIVESLPQDRIVRNMSQVDYEYQIDPNEPLINNSEDSNETQTNISDIVVNLEKQADKDFAKVGDVITYTNIIENNSTLEINNVNFIDIIPTNTSFVTNSVKVDGRDRLGENPQNGISIDSISTLTSVTVEFKVMIMSLPDDKQIENESQVNYKYQLSPNDPVENGTEDSNEVITNVEEISVNLSKNADKNFVKVGDEITYTSIVTNNSSIKIENVEFIDGVSVNTVFVQDSVIIDGNQSPGLDPNNPIQLGELEPNKSIIIQFRVTVESLPSDNQISNRSGIKYQYQLDQSQPIKEETEESNETITRAEQPMINVVKIPDKNIVEVGETLTYINVMQNAGSIRLDNVQFKDDIPEEVSFIENSVIVDGVSKPGLNPENPIGVGSLEIGDMIIISFRVEVESLPNDKKIRNISQINYQFQLDPTEPIEEGSDESNEAITNVEEVDVNIIKNVDKEIGAIGSILTYTNVISNDSTVDIQNVEFIDPIPENTTFVQSSILVNGLSRPDFNLDGPILIGTIKSMERAEIQFKVVVEEEPLNGEVSNIFETMDRYQLAPNEPIRNGNDESNEVLTTIISLNPAPPAPIIDPNIQIIKSSDKDEVKKGDIITYTVEITNLGDIIIFDSILRDSIPYGTTFIEDSVKINDMNVVGINPQDGINLASIIPQQKVVVEFKVRVECVCNILKIINSAVLGFNYREDNIGEILTGIRESNIVKNKLICGNCRIIKVKQKLILPQCSPSIKKVLDINASIDKNTCYIVNPSKVTTLDDEKIKIYDVIIVGKIVEKIIYLSDDKCSSIKEVQFKKPFKISTKIASDKIEPGCSKLCVDFCIKNNIYELLDSRTIFTKTILNLLGDEIN
ncbi:hypothetical protein [Clostridium oceanicum]|uniref:DUF11 domain-containing protein n=1 Tax=Clostridium oceanicum TaxID=1543 RepID=A0ABP3UXS2_9CLOT